MNLELIGADIGEAIFHRRAVRNYTDQPVDRSVVEQLLLAAVQAPVLANMTEFGKTPLFTVDEFCSAGVGLVLYPLSAFRAMNAAALRVYQTIRSAGTQKDLLDSMQTRDELYDLLDYHSQEQQT